MTRILSYNILAGGARRIDFIERMIRTADPDVVGLVEASNLGVVKELARRLEMDYRTNASPAGSSIALLSRLPIVRSAVHSAGGIISRPLLEVGLEEASGEKLTVFVNHLVASFWQGRGGDAPRRKEVRAILDVLRANHEPHVLMGDFNALAPGDRLQASKLVGYLTDVDRRYKHRKQDLVHHGNPSLNYIVPPPLRFVTPLLRLIPRSRVLSALCDEAAMLYAPRTSIALIKAAGYVDCFRYQNPRAWGFTCPAANPAGRIDYLFANPLLATRLRACKVVDGNGEVCGKDASDHLPIMADFGVGIEAMLRPYVNGLVEAEETASEAH
ncbi:MAG TPA: endonuclease/exonuclease/phosphatase family protein [Ktedonobacteraceae bacterium]|nr:endonuclease/exonuclease/phosphatase family protein [Ktedonobacteraceae bacterium]